MSSQIAHEEEGRDGGVLDELCDDGLLLATALEPDVLDPVAGERLHDDLRGQQSLSS